DEAVHKNSYKSKLYELISASLESVCAHAFFQAFRSGLNFISAEKHRSHGRAVLFVCTNF
ncbi:hypothetical protein, partial [uncultured Dialister sp.]|uniref:hypothetical protein n=1 Tax=uncultured Dialister sp. TaxID=278064 RepID=UPI0026771448